MGGGKVEKTAPPIWSGSRESKRKGPGLQGLLQGHQGPYVLPPASPPKDTAHPIAPQAGSAFSTKVIIRWMDGWMDRQS
jgi:hypothetical protein